MARDFAKYPENLSDSHGSPQDRGSADYYYGREKDPHYYPKGTGFDPKFTFEDMTYDEIRLYNEAYENETAQKNYGT